MHKSVTRHDRATLSWPDVLGLQTMERLADQEGGSEDQLVVPLSVMKGFFDKLLEQIIRAVQSTLDRASKNGDKCDYMLIVGGFGSSPYLIARLREAFSHQVLKEVVCPGVPSQAVLKAAPWAPTNNGHAVVCPCVLQNISRLLRIFVHTLVNQRHHQHSAAYVYTLV